MNNEQPICMISVIHDIFGDSTAYPLTVEKLMRLATDPYVVPGTAIIRLLSVDLSEENLVILQNLGVRIENPI